ncbi:MAG TPA: 5,6-dimethylbenzimidazole synthase [Nitrososphaeraceae archaeon]|nr:5,6-dimethylbenzimidazole synthase [Nitrososphaeraceae archaeon]
MSTSQNSFVQYEKDAVYKAIFSRRDVRTKFLNKKIPGNILARILNAAHHAPSVGFSQPWDFILVSDMKIREKIKRSFVEEFQKSVRMLESDQVRQRKYTSLKLEGILESSINICITYDPERFGPFVLGRTSVSETGVYSVCCAIQNLWLAARAEGLGMGWVSIVSNVKIREILEIPEHVSPVAYLCLGYVSEFEETPDLERSGWLPRLNLEDVVCYEKWRVHNSEKWAETRAEITRTNFNKNVK